MQSIPTSGCTGRHPGKSWISAEKNPHPSWAACSSVPSPSLWRSSFAYWCRTFYAPAYGCFPLFCPHRLLKTGWPCPLAPTLKIFININKITSDSSFSQGWTDPGHPALPHRRGAPGPLSSLWPPSGLTPGDPCLFLLGSPELDTVLQVRPDQGRVEGKDHLPWPAGHTPFNIPQNSTGLTGHKGTLQAYGQPVIHQDPRSFSAEPLSSKSSPNLYWYLWLFLLRCKTLHLHS